MHALLDHVSQKQSAFSKHALFGLLSDDLTVERALSFTPLMTFWVMGFQDILRLNEQMMSEGPLKRMARHHRVEDSGHDLWFLEDLGKLSSGAPDLKALFGRTHAAVRDATYALVAEVYRAHDDVERIVLLHSLEATGHLFFEKFAAVVDRQNSLKLKYFSGFHLKIEKAHQVFEDKMTAELRAIRVSDEQRARAMALIDRVFSAFDTMFNAWTAEFLADKRGKESVPLAGTTTPAPLQRRAG